MCYDPLGLIFTLTLWTKTTEFTYCLNALRKPIAQDVLNIFRDYQHLKELTRLLNRGLGINMTLYIIQIMFAYAIYFDDTISTDGFISTTTPTVYLDVLENSITALYFTCSLVPILLAADTAHKVI